MFLPLTTALMGDTFFVLTPAVGRLDAKRFIRPGGADGGATQNPQLKLRVMVISSLRDGETASHEEVVRLIKQRLVNGRWHQDMRLRVVVAWIAISASWRPLLM